MRAADAGGGVSHGSAPIALPTGVQGGDSGTGLFPHTSPLVVFQFLPRDNGTLVECGFLEVEPYRHRFDLSFIKWRHCGGITLSDTANFHINALVLE